MAATKPSISDANAAASAPRVEAAAGAVEAGQRLLVLGVGAVAVRHERVDVGARVDVGEVGLAVPVEVAQSECCRGSNVPGQSAGLLVECPGAVVQEDVKTWARTVEVRVRTVVV